jgi:hypothetical protein
MSVIKDTTTNKPTIKTNKDDDDNVNVSFENTLNSLTNFLLPFAFAAAIISWFRNSDSNVIMRIIYAFFAYVFNLLYIVYVLWKWLTATKE